ncbi:MAG: HAMP domain-containing sensor histidine kinase [Planctomycetota bacterium]
MLRSRPSLLFALILGLSFAMLVWWTTFLVSASEALAAAGERLAAADPGGALRALGAADAGELAELGHRRRVMFASEGAFFAAVLLGLAWLFVASVRREAAARQAHDRFLAGATHELKTPLATIRLLLESLREGRVADDKRSQWLATGIQEAERLERGLDNVLTAAGLRTTVRRPAREAGDLAADVQAAVDALRGRALAGGIAVTVTAPGRLPWQRDAAAIQLVLRNLLDNAIKYSAAGGHVRISVADEGHTARIAVADEGRGLDAVERAHAFEPFWRGNDAASGGAGLGLHLVHELVAAHGGTIAIASAGRDQGSTFTVVLPTGGEP